MSIRDEEDRGPRAPMAQPTEPPRRPARQESTGESFEPSRIDTPPRASRPDQPEFSIDFDTFARSEAEIVQRDPIRPLVALSPAPQRRAIVARNWLPPGDSIVESRPVGSMTVVTLRGRINEAFRGAEFGQSLRGAVVFDLSHVDRISSFGVKAWLQMMERARFTSCYLFRCSEAVIHQITMMRNFCGAARIHSLLVPYQCGACGEEFSPVYDAVGDRELLRGRSAIPVECPRCGASAKMVEDPWAYLSLDDHLLETMPPDLQQVVEYLVQPARTDAIEKFVSERETRIRIHAPLDGRLRLSRALGGLEGRVVFDVSPRPDTSPQAAERLLDAIRQLDDEVTEVWIDGANRAITASLLANPIRRTYISTAFVTLINPTGARRPVLVDVRRKRASLLRGEMPVLEGGASLRGAAQPDDLDLVFAAARQLVQTPRMRTGTMTPDHADTRTATPPSRQLTPTLPAAPRATWSVPSWQLLVFAGSTAGLAGLAFVVGFAAVMGNLGSDPDREDNGTASVSEWRDAGELPPAWTESAVAVEADGVRVSGMAKGETPEIAAERSRRLAIYHLVQHVARELGTTPAGPGIGADPGDEAAADVAAAYLDEMGAIANPTRTDDDVKRNELGYTVATRYLLATADLRKVITHYGQTYQFRGLTVSRRFPFRRTASSSAVVASAESWFSSISPGDPIVQVDDTVISTFEDFARLAPKSFNEGSDAVMHVWVIHEGERTRVDFRRPDKGIIIDAYPKKGASENLQ